MSTPKLDVSCYPATRFYGSKRKHLEWIATCLKRLNYDSVLDLFGGTGSVSMLFETLGKKVTYHDSAYFNFRQARALFAPSGSFDFASLTDSIKAIKPVSGFVARNFKNDYFTHEENRWLDGYVKFDQKHSTSPLNKDAIFYCVAQACLQKRPFNLFHRKNLYLRLSAISRSFGNATTWETPFDTLAKGHLDALRKYVDRAHSGVPVQVIAPAPPSKIRSRADLIYLDPPYILASRSTETYAQRYHFIDGLSSPNSWESWNKLGDSPWYKSKTLSEPWGDRAVFLDLLATVLDEHRESICVMSYMDGGYPSAETLTKLFKKRFKKVNVHKRSVQRALSISESGELLIVGE